MTNSSQTVFPTNILSDPLLVMLSSARVGQSEGEVRPEILMLISWLEESRAGWLDNPRHRQTNIALG